MRRRKNAAGMVPAVLTDEAKAWMRTSMIRAATSIASQVPEMTDQIARSLIEDGTMDAMQAMRWVASMKEEKGA